MSVYSLQGCHWVGIRYISEVKDMYHDYFLELFSIHIFVLSKLDINLRVISGVTSNINQPQP